jgi:prohibitin 1
MSTFLFFVALLLIVLGFATYLTLSRQTTPNQFGPYGKAGGLGAALFGVLILVMLCITKVPNGHVGVISNFGKVEDGTLDPGLSFVAPWSEVTKISAQTLEIKEDMQVPTKEGLTVELETSVLWHINARKAAILYKTVGEEYWEVLLVPQFRSVVRGVTASYEAKALYASTRDEVQNKIAEELRTLVEPRGIVIESTPLRKVVLPEPVTAALNAKASAEQNADAMRFKLLAESQEAERKVIEARGDSAAQAIINSTISDRYLTLKGIEATLELAKSNNAKTVVIGAGDKGMPLILGQ